MHCMFKFPAILSAPIKRSCIESPFGLSACSKHHPRVSKVVHTYIEEILKGLIANMISLRSNTASLATIVKRSYHNRALLGKRETVGPGFNNQLMYVDRADFPYPASRWGEPDAKIDALREKEKGDWKNLSIEEKKALYRYSYRQTFSEMNAPTGDWKIVVGGTMIAVGITFWIYAFLKKFVYSPMPKSCSEEAKLAQLERMVQLRANPIDGIGSKWDYENNRWK
ncbi:cytochrome c oxidase subunit 4 isoform 1, mitochondrial-like isoform X1 [Varroa destructor]|uniref:Cytochrome c oxidase subunit 4 n=1 Tax=Varroa destructor TaxID=109461 RepID=A0A7M7JQ95_VARDE|nr:cytochrome c oxidase subunit 4 isoform 1, mitochondrial-like isoform X1 [Varroa destructor]